MWIYERLFRPMKLKEYILLIITLTATYCIGSIAATPIAEELSYRWDTGRVTRIKMYREEIRRLRKVCGKACANICVHPNEVTDADGY